LSELKLQQEGLTRFLTVMGKMPGDADENHGQEGQAEGNEKFDTEEMGD
jgi:hypothetical protein